MSLFQLLLWELFVIVVGRVAHRFVPPTRGHNSTIDWLRIFVALLLTIVLGLAAWAITSREGISLSSVVLVAVSILLTLALFLLLFKVRPESPNDDDHSGLVWIVFRRDFGRSFRRGVTVWSTGAVLFVPVLLMYAGVLDPKATDIISQLTLGKFRPVITWAPISAGQCIKSRDPQQINAVVPCSHPHKSQVVEQVNEDEPCPQVHDLGYDLRGLDLRLIKVGPFMLSAFCVLQSVGPTRLLHERLGPRELAFTP